MGVVFGRKSNKSKNITSVNFSTNLSEGENLLALKSFALLNLQKYNDKETVGPIFESSNKRSILELTKDKRSASESKFNKFCPLLLTKEEIFARKLNLPKINLKVMF